MSTGIRLCVRPWSPAADLPVLLAGCDACVYTASLAGDDARVEQALPRLSPSERQRFLSYTNGVVSRRFAIGRAIVRDLLGVLTGMEPAEVPLRTGEHGKLSLGPSCPRQIWFSVAHCEDLLLVALSRTFDVGIDVERSRSIEHWERVADRVLAPVEMAQLRYAVNCGEDAGTAFLRQWCRVEAELKAIGCGIEGLDAHRAGQRPLGLRVVDLGDLALPDDVAASGARYQAAVALCAPGAEMARQTHVAAHQAIRPTSAPARASTA